MGVNKVVMNTGNGPETLIDLTGDSVTPETLAAGATAHDASGEVIRGTMPTTAVLYTAQTLTEAQKAQARANIGAQAVLTEADQEAIVQQVIAALGTPVFGRVDEENNIIITASLADGTYTLKYENADGTKLDIGTIELGNNDAVVDESGPIALTMTYGVKLDKNTGKEGSATGYAASQSIPYDSAYEYTMSTTNDKHAYGTACWYDASGGYLGWNDIIVGGTGEANSGVLKPLAGASAFRLRIIALNSGDETRISLRKDLIQQEG